MSTTYDGTGRVALVTGSTSGIGAEVARRLAGDGYTVVLNSRSSTDVGEAMAAELGGHYVQGDIAVEADAARIVAEAVQRAGPLDVLVNNAATTQSIPHADFETASPEVFRRLYDTNVVGTWAVTVAAIPHLRESAHGCVVNVSSLAGVRPVGSSIPYAVSKAALNHLTVLLANVVGPQVRVNAVAPGFVETPWTADWDDLRAAVTAMAPMQRTATPADVVEAVLMLVRSDYITGQIVVVDGGLSLR